MVFFLSCSMWLIVWMTLLIANWKTSVAIGIEEFYPFGLKNGDSHLQSADDESGEHVVKIPFIGPFEFFGQQHTFVSVLTNGLLLLNQSDVAPNFSPMAFPTGRILIAPFWADADTREIGTVYFRTTVNENQLNKTANNINRFFGIDFSPVHLFVSTWYKVGYFKRKVDKTNTFQCILATDHSSSFVIFLYKEGGIQWAAGESTRAIDTEGFATVGFDAGDGKHFINVIGSNTANIINISTTSNVDIPGIWAFQVNIPQISDPCATHPCHSHANCVQVGLTNDFNCTCTPPYSGNGTVCTASSTTMSIQTITTDHVFVTDVSGAFVDSRIWTITSVVIFGVLFLVLLPGAVYGYVRVGMFILSGEKELFKNSSSTSKTLNSSSTSKTEYIHT